MEKEKQPLTSQQLKERIERFKQRYPEPPEAPHEINSMIGRASRLGIELLAGVLIGVGLGVWLDHWLDVSPWGIFGGFLLGSGAGLWNIRRLLG